MAKEQEQYLDPVPVTGIYLDIPTRTLLLSHGSDLVASLRLAPEGVLFRVHHDDVLPADVVTPAPLPEPQTTAEMTGTKETERPKPVTLQGRLKSKPRPGRPDRNDQPTAWARFAAHIEGEEGAHVYSTTFHRNTAEIALSLDKDMPVTVQGYPHESDDPGSRRMDTLSVINLLEYPGRPRNKT